MAKWHRKQNECPQCGRQREECSDPATAWYPQQTVCYPTREAAAARARYERIHEKAPWHNGEGEWAEHGSAEFPYHRDAGVNIWVAPMDLGMGGDFLQLKRDDDEGDA